MSAVLAGGRGAPANDNENKRPAHPPARAGRRVDRPPADWGAIGLDAPAQRPALETVDQVVADYLASEHFGALSVGARRKNARYAAKLCAVFGARRLADLSAPDVEHWLTGAPGPATRRGWYGIVAVVWRHGRRAGAVDADAPTKALAWPAGGAPRTRYVNDGELQAFSRLAENRLRAYLALKVATGLRRGQIWGLNWSAWNADAGELSAPAAKAGYATRYVGEGVAAAVAAVAGAFGRGAPADAMICTRKGGRYRHAGHMVRVEWDRARAAWIAAGGEPFREHDLRAKVATDAADVQRAMLLLGHTSARVTESVYRRMGRVVEGNERSRVAITLDADADTLPRCELTQLDLFAPAGGAKRGRQGERPLGERGALIASEYAGGETIAALARTHGLAKSTIIFHIRRRGGELRGAPQAALDADAMAWRYEGGESVDSIARAAGVSANTVRKRLRAAGVELRGRGQYPRKTQRSAA